MNSLIFESHFVVEMANFIADVADLPANIVLWTKTQPLELPHTKYRMTVMKDRLHSATYLIGVIPNKIWDTPNKKIPAWLIRNERSRTGHFDIFFTLYPIYRWRHDYR